MQLSRICVFCGSNRGVRASYARAAETLGQALGQQGLGLVYGGGNVGLMGVVADAALAAGAHVIGVIPKMLVERELAHRGLSELRVVASMHERKATMAELADAFVMLPGGFGTFEEFCEVLTWVQLGLHQKACAVLDVDGYYAPLVAQFDRAVEEGFLAPAHRRAVVCASDVPALLAALRAYVPVNATKWLDRDAT